MVNRGVNCHTYNQYHNSWAHNMRSCAKHLAHGNMRFFPLPNSNSSLTDLQNSDMDILSFLRVFFAHLSHFRLHPSAGTLLS